MVSVAETGWRAWEALGVANTAPNALAASSLTCGHLKLNNAHSENTKIYCKLFTYLKLAVDFWVKQYIMRASLKALTRRPK